jgi:hypothetical protein
VLKQQCRLLTQLCLWCISSSVSCADCADNHVLWAQYWYQAGRAGGSAEGSDRDRSGEQQQQQGKVLLKAVPGIGLASSSRRSSHKAILAEAADVASVPVLRVQQ